MGSRWHTSWEHDERSRAVMGVEERLGHQIFQLKDQLEAANKELAAAKALGFDAAKAEEEYRRQMEERLELERQRRVEEMKMKAMRRIGQLSLSLGYWHYIGRAMLAFGGVGVGVAHFYTMEIDYKYVLQVRPFAFLPFPLALVAIYSAVSA